MRRLKLYFKVLFFNIIIILLLAEMLVRLFIPKVFWEFKEFELIFDVDQRIGWLQKPNLDIVECLSNGELTNLKTNSDGLMPNNAQRQRTPGLLRILMFGDSTIVGREVSQDEKIHLYLEQKLASKGIKAEVINAGVQGYSTDQVFLYM